MFLLFYRILKFSIQDVTRNVWLTIATVTILVLALFSVNMMLSVKAVSERAVEVVKEKVDISLYLKPEAAEVDIMALKTKLEGMEEVKNVQYTSKQDALISFREKNKNNPEILDALKELGRNPLSPSLVIAPKESGQVAPLIERLKKIDSVIIESRDFSDNSLILEKINAITKKVNDAGLVIITIFILTSLMVVYNSIKVAIYTHRREVEIMRLVGSSNTFIYLPFIFSAVIYSLLATAIVASGFLVFLSFVQPYLDSFFGAGQLDLVAYFASNGIIIFSLELIAIAVINGLASLLAIRKYARI